MLAIRDLIGVERETCIVISFEEVRAHCGAHGDTNLIHKSASSAQKVGVYGGVIVPGWHISGRAVGQISKMFSDVSPEFETPLLSDFGVVVGDYPFIVNEPIYINWKIASSRTRPGRLQIVQFEGVVKNFMKKQVYQIQQKIVFV